MSQRTVRPGRPGRQIQGPQSALTDFLASHNIDATRIRRDADARREAALTLRQAAEVDDGAAGTTPDVPKSATRSTRPNETKLQEKKRKREEDKAISKIKASKQFQRRRRGYDPDDLSDEDESARAFYKDRLALLPGQIENCELCETRFTVTAYSRCGPNGSMLCPKCSKELDKEEGTKKAKKKTKTRGGNRRQAASQLLDGILRHGAKDLMTLCIESLAKNVHLAEDLGDLPPKLIYRLAALLSKRRLITSSTLELFLRSSSDTVAIFDGAKLNSDDYTKIFQTVPKLKHFQARDAIQFKNNVIEYLTGCPVTLETFSIHGANLIDDERWNLFLTEKGRHLRSLKVYHTDCHFGDEQLDILKVTCPDLVRLKVSHNQKITDEGIVHIASLPLLQFLSLEIYIPTTTEPYLEILNSIGNSLRTFSLSTIQALDDRLLSAIHKNCINLSKLRLTDNETLTDGGFTALFTNWNNPPLRFIDLHKCRHLDSAVPRENPDNIGLCSNGFEALMRHSGSELTNLNIHSCRHISTQTFETVFSDSKIYPELINVDVSFCWGIDDFVVSSIFRTCPKLKTLKVFGNFAVKHVRVPKGKILIGMPNAMGMQIEGEDGDDE